MTFVMEININAIYLFLVVSQHLYFDELELYNPLEYKGLNHYSHSSYTYITMVHVKSTLHLIDNFLETYTGAFYFVQGNMQSIT